jgi:hypothetical protein
VHLLYQTAWTVPVVTTVQPLDWQNPQGHVLLATYAQQAAQRQLQPIARVLLACSALKVVERLHIVLPVPGALKDLAPVQMLLQGRIPLVVVQRLSIHVQQGITALKALLSMRTHHVQQAATPMPLASFLQLNAPHVTQAATVLVDRHRHQACALQATIALSLHLHPHRRHATPTNTA